MEYTVRTLSSEEYPLWDKLAATSPQRSIFTNRWWMDIVTDGGVRLLGCFDKERMVAGFPIWPVVTLGVKRLRQPPLTPYWGPLLTQLDGKYLTRLSTEIEILRAFALALAPWPDITIAFHPSLSNWLPYYWNGFSETTRYTFRIEQLKESLASGKSTHRSIRCALNRAESNKLQIVETVDPMVIAEMSRLSMARQDIQSSSEIRAFWPELFRAAQDRKCAFSAAAVDPSGNTHAGYAMVWDDRYAYHLYGGGPPEYRDSGGGVFALQQIIERAAEVAPSFDFEGSMIESIGRFFRQFGGELVPYHFVTRADSLRLNIARQVKKMSNRQRKTRKEIITPPIEETALANSQ